MAETGLLEFITRRSPVNNETCEQRKKERMTNARALSLVEVGAVFVILVVGLATSGCILLLEVLFQKAREVICHKLGKD